MRQVPDRAGALRKRLDAFTHQLPGVEHGRVEALHLTRVACRRLRELLPLLPLDPDAARRLNRRLRKITRRLGTVRELDVLQLLTAKLRPDPRYPAPALDKVGAVISQQRHAARERLAARLPAAKLKRIAHKLDRIAGRVEFERAPSRTGTPARAWLWALDARLARRAARLRSVIQAAGALYAPERLHAVRLAIKKLRYAVELSSEAGRRQTGALVALKKAQDLLGQLHDRQTLVAMGRDVQASLSPPDLVAWGELGSLVHAIEDDCRQLHALYMRDRAALLAIADRLGAETARTAVAAARSANG